jgi:hypothetical protein
MTRAEIARLKEELAADYKRKLEALELVEQMLNQQQKSKSPTGSRNKVQLAQVGSSAKGSGTIAARIEQAFQKQPNWTIPSLMTATGAKNHSSIWMALSRLIKDQKVRISRKSSGRRPTEYTRVIK